MIRLFLLDDHAVVREGVRTMLSLADDIEVVGEAGRAQEAVDEIVRLRPDVALVDVQLPDGSGVDVIRQVRSRTDDVACIIFTSFADDEAFFQSVVAGSVGYLLKDTTANELIAAVRVAASGGSLVRREVVDDLRRRASEVPSEDHLLRGLSPQERRIILLVVDGLTNREVAERLSLAEKTVRNYVSLILGKLGMRNRTELAVYVAARPEGGAPRGDRRPGQSPSIGHRAHGQRHTT